MWSQNRDDCGLKRLVLWVATAIENTLVAMANQIEGIIKIVTTEETINGCYSPRL